MIRVVFDTNILYSAIIKPIGNEGRAFDFITEGLVIPCVSPAVLDEYHLVLFRPALRQHRERITQVLQIFAAAAVHVTPPRTLKISAHEKDNRIYECAAASGADYIVTGNTRHFKTGNGRTQIVNASQLLSLIPR